MPDLPADIGKPHGKRADRVMIVGVSVLCAVLFGVNIALLLYGLSTW